jgi:predicted ATPase
VARDAPFVAESGEERSRHPEQSGCLSCSQWLTVGNSGDVLPAGTLEWLGLLAPIVDALEHGSVLLADELDASLHPVLAQQLIRLFQNPITNPPRAQLISNAHDLNLVDSTGDKRLIGRDQVWFTEKQATGGTRLYPLLGELTEQEAASAS